MSQIRGANHGDDVPGLTLFDALAPLARAVTPDGFVQPADLSERLKTLRQDFGRDRRRVEALADVLTGPDITTYGARAADVFAAWDKAGGSPSLPALVAFAIDYFRLDGSSPEARMLFMAAVLGEVPNDLVYHGNEHYRKVLFHLIRLIATHNGIFAETARCLTDRQIALVLAACCIHDLGHQGVDNMAGGVYRPGFVEQRAFNIARPYFKALGVDADALADIEIIIFCTDITFLVGENSPCLHMKKIYKHYFWDDNRIDISHMFLGKLRRFEDNPALAQMAMMMHEADVGSSAGLSYDRTVNETKAIMAERGVETVGPEMVLSFLREQLGETMFTEAGRQIFGPAMHSVIEEAEKDVAAGRKSF